jgi:protease I
MQDLRGKKVAIVVADGFEEVELTEPRRALEEAGAKTVIVSPVIGPIKGKVKGWRSTDWGRGFKVEEAVASVNADDFDALLLPGGVLNPDHLRGNQDVQRFVKGFFDAGKPVAAICHGPWTLIDAGVVSGRHLTSYPSIQTDLKNAGASWTDEEVVVDHNLVTSRKPDDIPAFNRVMIEVFAKTNLAVH